MSLVQLYCAHSNLHFCPTEYKQSQKRDRDNAPYEQNKDVILQRLCETHRQKKATAVLKSGEHTQPDTPMSNIFPIGLNTVIMATDEFAVIRLTLTPTIEGFVS